MSGLPSVVVVAPRFDSLRRFGAAPLDVDFRLLTRSGAPASTPNLDALINSQVSSPPLSSGLPNANPAAGYYLQGFLRQAGYDVHVVFDWQDDVELERGLACDPVAVLLSTTFITDPAMLGACVGALRRACSTTPIIVGGPYVYKQARELTRGLDVELAARMRRFSVEYVKDLLFIGNSDPILSDVIFIASPNGERTLLKVFKEISAGGDSPGNLADVPNLVLQHRDGTWGRTEEWLEPFDVNEDFTRWDLVDRLPPFVPIRTSIGCPHRCTFCDFYRLHAGITLRRVESVVREIKLATARGRGFFNFVDDNVLLSKARTEALCTGLIDAEVDIAWGGFFRLDRVDENNVQRLLDSGCRLGLCGVESADPGQLERMNRECSLDKIRRGVELCSDAGINLGLTFILGFPGETRATVDRTVAFLNQLPTTSAGTTQYELFPFYLFPGSEVDSLAFRERYGLHGRYANWRHDTMSFETVTREWGAYFFKNVESIPYGYYTVDRLRGWDAHKMAAVFGARKRLTERFIDGAVPTTIQDAFAALFELISSGQKYSTPPPWETILADASRQPGARRAKGAHKE